MRFSGLGGADRPVDNVEYRSPFSVCVWSLQGAMELKARSNLFPQHPVDSEKRATRDLKEESAENRMRTGGKLEPPEGNDDELGDLLAG